MLNADIVDSLLDLRTEMSDLIQVMNESKVTGEARATWLNNADQTIHGIDGLISDLV